MTTFERAGVPTIARMPDGRLIIAHQHFPADDPASFDKDAVHFSSDDGATWGAPQVIRVAGLPARNRAVKLQNFPYARSMVPSSPSAPGGACSFATTRWSIVLAARAPTEDAGGIALAALCRSYWYPLYAFVRRQGLGEHDAQDLTQEFFARLLEKGWLGSVERERGRFRSWLLASMKHFLANEWDRSRAQKRGGGAVTLSFDAMSAESRFRHEPADTETAEKLYDRRWALTLLDQVLARLREEMHAAEKVAHFDALKFCLTGDQTPYAEVAVALGMSEGAVKVAVHRLRERYRDLIRAEIAETVATAPEVEDELRYLLAALSG